MSSTAATPAPVFMSRAPETLAERFWSLAKGMEDAGPDADPVDVVRAVLAVLDQVDTGAVGRDVTVNTLSFLALLRQHEVKGDLLYASPEQARGESMDERSLVFSVGVLLFERLTGRHPFGVEGNPNRVARIRKGEIASGVNFFPKVPADLRTVLVKAMGPFPEERYESLAALREELEAFIAHTMDAGWSVDELPLPEMRTRPSQQRPLARPPRRRVQTRPGFLDKAAAPSSVPTPVTEHGTERVFKAQVATPSRWKPIVLVVVGAALGAGMFAIATRGGDSASAATTAADQTPPAQRAIVSEPVITPVADSKDEAAETAETAEAAKAAIAPAPDTATAVAPVAAVAAEPAVFDMDVGGEAALIAAKTCFADGRALQFAVSLVYGKADGLSRKIYWGPTPMLEAEEKTCLSKALLGVSAGAAPDTNTVVLHRFSLRHDGDRVKSRIE